MPISIKCYDIPISHEDLALTRDKLTKVKLRKKLNKWMRSHNPIEDALPNITDADINLAIKDFAECIVFGALDSIAYYFKKLVVAGYTVGGRRSTNLAWLYEKERIEPSPSHVGAIGEGVAGYYLENYEKLEFAIRPFGVSPDMIFTSPNDGRPILVEAKATLHRKNPELKFAIELLQILANTKYINRRPSNYSAYLIHVNILGINEYELIRVGLHEGIRIASSKPCKYSPKRLQKEERYEDAISDYSERFNKAIIEGDTYLVSLYADEIIQTILESQLKNQKANDITYPILQHIVADKMARLSDSPYREVINKALETSMQQRFKEEFEMNPEGSRGYSKDK